MMIYKINIHILMLWIKSLKNKMVCSHHQLSRGTHSCPCTFVLATLTRAWSVSQNLDEDILVDVLCMILSVSQLVLLHWVDHEL